MSGSRGGIKGMKRIRIKMLVAVTIGAFTTFTTLLYVITSESAACGTANSRLCLYVESTNVSYGYRGEEEEEEEEAAAAFASRIRVLTERSSEYVVITSNLAELFGGREPGRRRRNDPRYRYYAERQRSLREGCRRYNESGRPRKLDHILVDDSRKILFCYVPKVACTNWKRVFMLLTGKARNMSEAVRIPAYEVHARNLFASLQNYTERDVDRILRDYTKIIFVRNPFERLLSAYRNKLEQHYDSSKYFQARFGKYIVRKFRKNAKNESLARGDDVTFAEFVSYLVASDSGSYNEHWQTVTDLCRPCLVEYDVIGKYETLTADSDFVLDRLNLNFSFPALERPSRTASNLKKYFDTVAKDDIYKLYRIYEMDFKLFGYDLFKTLNWSRSM